MILDENSIQQFIFINAREQCMEAALTDALNWLETGGGDVVSKNFEQIKTLCCE